MTVWSRQEHAMKEAAILSWGRAGRFSEAQRHPSKPESKRTREKLRSYALT